MGKFILKFDKSINIIQGENGVGKTTLLALLYSLFHDSGIIKFTNKNQEAYICMNLHDSKEKLVLKKVYKKDNLDILYHLLQI